jgi:hypothetical protein
VHRAVVFDVNFRASFRDDALDRFAAGSDERSDFLGIILIVSIRGAYFDNSARG